MCRTIFIIIIIITMVLINSAIVSKQASKKARKTFYVNSFGVIVLYYSLSGILIFRRIESYIAF